MVLLPLIGAAAAIRAIQPRYEGFVTFAIAPQPDGFSAGAEGPSHPAAEFESYRRELIEVAWKVTNARHSDVAGGSMQWSVAANVADSQLRLRVRGDSVDETRHWLDTVADAYTKQLQTYQADAAARDLAAQVRLARLEESWQEAVAESELEVREASRGINADDPAALLLADCDELGRVQSRHEELRARLVAAERERENLLRAPPPTTAVVNPELRQQAHASNETLREDLRHLEVQLTQVKSILLSAKDTCGDSLRRVVDLAGSLSTATTLCDDAPTADLRALFERIGEMASDHRDLTDGLAQFWTQTYLGLDSAAVDPADPVLIELHERLWTRVGDYIHKTDESLRALRLRLLAIGGSADEQARNHVQVSELTRLFHQLRDAQQEFVAAASALDAQHSYVLDAALRTARGLAHRTRAVRRALDAELEDAAIKQAIAARQARIDVLTSKIGELRDEINSGVDAMLDMQRRVRMNVGRVPGYIDAVAELQAARTRHDLLAGRDPIGAEASRADTMLKPPRLDPAAVTTVGQVVEDRPANMSAIAGVGLLGWSLTLLGLVGVVRLPELFRPEAI
jgi:hypothetical protein